MKHIALILALCSVAMPGWADSMARQITVTGEGAVRMVPDMAVISVGVTHQDTDAAEAMARASRATADMLKRLNASGIAGRDVQTSQVNLTPVYSNRSSNETPQIQGFRAELMMTVRVRNLDSLGGVLGAVVLDGANQFAGLQFALSEPEGAQDAARKAAVADALRKAGIYAEAANVKLGAVMSISENSGGSYPEMRMAAAGKMMDVPIAEGELAISQSVTLVIALD